MGSTTDLDQDLNEGLKAAKSKRCYFALILKGGTDGALLVSKSKISPNAIAAAKKSSGGSALVSGFVSFKDDEYLFETGKIPPATAAQAVKTIAKRDAEMTIHANFRLSQDPELANLDGKPHDGQPHDGQPSSGQPGSGQPGSGQPGSGQATATATQTTQQSPQESKPHGALPEAVKFASALEEWEHASAQALDSTDKLIAALEAANDELADAIAAVVEKLKADFPDTLDDALGNLAAAAKEGNSGEAESYRNKSEIAIKAALAYLNNNAKTIEGCEHNPFGVQISFRAPLTEALKQVLIKVKK